MQQGRRNDCRFNCLPAFFLTRSQRGGREFEPPAVHQFLRYTLPAPPDVTVTAEVAERAEAQARFERTPIHRAKRGTATIGYESASSLCALGEVGGQVENAPPNWLEGARDDEVDPALDAG